MSNLSINAGSNSIPSWKEKAVIVKDPRSNSRGAQDHISQSTKTSCDQAITYSLKPNLLKTFADPSKPFLSFDQFIAVVQWYRDVYYGPDNVVGFSENIGRTYNVWTRSAVSSYHRHIFPDELTDQLTISFEVPPIKSAAWFPLVVRMYDEQGLYFLHEQRLVIERYVTDRFILSSWKKVPELREFLVSQGGPE